MRSLFVAAGLAAMFAIAGGLLDGNSFAQGQETEQRFPPYRSPNQKQADYARSQAQQQYVPPTFTIPQPRYYGRRYFDPYGIPYRYGLPYGYYDGFYPPLYPTYYPPVYRAWPVTPYPFRVP